MLKHLFNVILALTLSYAQGAAGRLCTDSSAVTAAIIPDYAMGAYTEEMH